MFCCVVFCCVRRGVLWKCNLFLFVRDVSLVFKIPDLCGRHSFSAFLPSTDHGNSPQLSVAILHPPCLMKPLTLTFGVPSCFTPDLGTLFPSSLATGTMNPICSKTCRKQSCLRLAPQPRSEPEKSVGRFPRIKRLHTRREHSRHPRGSTGPPCNDTKEVCHPSCAHDDSRNQLKLLSTS